VLLILLSFLAWYSGVEYEQYAFLNRATGPYWWAYWSMMTCNVFLSLCGLKKLRTSIMFSFIISIVNIGMWFERFVIIVTSSEIIYHLLGHVFTNIC
jgi:molybdopterin-containing oxidoreductase family membrane subunit